MTFRSEPLVEPIPEKALRPVLDSLGAAVLVADGDGLVRLANRDWEEIFGLRDEEVAGRPLAELQERLAGMFHQPALGRSLWEPGQVELGHPAARTLQCLAANTRGFVSV